MRNRGSSTLYPILTFDLSDTTTYEELDTMFEIFKQVERRPGKHVTLTDTTAILSMPDAKKRAYVAQKQTAKDKVYGERSIGAVVVVNSTVVRGALTAISWVKPMTMRHEFVATRAEGMRVCMQWLFESGIYAPEAANAYLRELARDPGAPFP